MKSQTCFLIVLFIFRCLLAEAQCDPQVYGSLKEVGEPFKLLKRYTVTSRALPDVPFSAQYSYVFTKGNTYGFTLRQSDENPPLNFTLTNFDKQILNNDFVEVTLRKQTIVTYTAPVTGIYYLNLYSPQSFDGCAVFQLSFHQEGDGPFSSSQKKFRDDFKRTSTSKNVRQLKDFLITAGKSSEYSYVFTKGKKYGIYISKESGDPSDIKMNIRSKEEFIIPRKSDLGNGEIFVIEPKETGIYYLTFVNEDNKHIAMARLIAIEGNLVE